MHKHTNLGNIHIQFFERHSKVLYEGRYFFFFLSSHFVLKEFGINQLLFNQNFYLSVRISCARMVCRRTNYALLSIGPDYYLFNSIQALSAYS